ncbi:MAG: bifunctional (p)ppGpp synthetase/guanosine-3',5'-bis(diphosphate) 3'-pyrophosphohydrolase [Oscillospiraceae bacterium]|jgi:GTP pyrophosphokinase|nr:bifunctional (p)ppGpp synthetase/guanosine-3',5'-bis(diphosphate) 3'-pyrophosphohydrolase [Oscillospiraceae bacterium]
MNTDFETDKRFEDILGKMAQGSPAVNTDRIKKAYEYARDSHAGQMRKSGEPYIIHPLEVAKIIFEMGMDEDSMISALLHDVIEDTEYGYEDIKREFGQSVATIVDGVTKLTRVQYTYKEDEQMENLRKMLLAMAKDIRVILIKIADRLHNMRTSEYWDEQKRRDKALETMEIYAPLAHRLGIQRIKSELEDLALKCLDPVGYKEITDELSEREANHQNFLAHIKENLSEKLVEYGIKAEIQSRIKHVYSIYRKMYNQQKAMYEIYDLYAVRIVVDEMVDCYNVLGIVHDVYKPIPGRFKDYISTPKPNLYKSLHTTVIGREGMPFEVQIRTWEMHHTAEYGIAAHWKYKSGVQGGVSLDQKLEWVRRLLETQEDADADEFIRTLKIDMFADEVFVFTPKGDVINLPAGATPIDFAYAIHSAVGNRMTGAKVNGKIATYDYLLQNGDIVEIITSKTIHGPSRGWLEIAKTPEARNKIRQWFKKEKREENIARGREMFETQIRKLGFSPADISGEDVLPSVLKRVSFGSLEELYAAIGYGGITSIRAANRVRDELVRLNKLGKEETAVKAPPKKPKRSESGVIVEGIDNCLVKFSRCCTPVPGDDIIGFVTRGYGVSIHCKDCQNVSALERAHDEGRWLKVYWAEETGDKYETSIELSAKDRPDLVVDIMTALSAMHISVNLLNARRFSDGYNVVNMAFDVKDIEQLRLALTRLARINGVVRVSRKSYDN